MAAHRARRGANIVTVAVARELVGLAWQLLTKREEYAFRRPAALAEKHRTLELTAGAERRQGRRDGERVSVSAGRRKPDKQLAGQAELACRRLTADWQAAGPRWARARHRGAHLQGRLSGKPRGRPAEPQQPALRSVSRPYRIATIAERNPTVETT